ncbi:MAG: PIG-L domain-containing protein [Micrococcales bacterium]|nr:PIG-L domain-containing protein [Micrococcales bacterium]
MPRTLVFFHAHPDDEALLTSGTMARAAAEGQRVVLITATSGEAGLAAHNLQDRGLADVREEELVRSARMLGVQRLELLHYADSGLHGDRIPTDGTTTLCQTPVAEIAADVAKIVEQERADVLVTYDAAGGYGHPDHIRVHESGLAAATLADTPQVFAVTAPREPFAIGARLADRLLPLPEDFSLEQFETAFTPRRNISHRVNVRRYVDFKRAALRAHTSQASGADIRTISALLDLPRPLFSLLLGTEFYQRLR